MNTYLKLASWVGKILVLILLAYLSLGLFFVEGVGQLAVGFFIAIFITIPTIFIFFFKDKFLAKYPKLIFAWKVIYIIYLIITILFILALAIGQYIAYQKDKTSKTIDFINSKTITLDDVMGKNLPPQPNQELNNSTIAGIDANKNFIRDDVELAIFAKYPNSAKIRSAELQYAQALQLELTQVYDSKTLVAAIRKEEYGSLCIGETGPEVSLKDSRESIISGLAVANNRTKEVEDLAVNTDMRKKYQENILNKYMTTYSVPSSKNCDIDILSLPN